MAEAAWSEYSSGVGKSFSSNIVDGPIMFLLIYFCDFIMRVYFAEYWKAHLEGLLMKRKHNSSRKDPYLLSLVYLLLGELTKAYQLFSKFVHSVSKNNIYLLLQKILHYEFFTSFPLLIS